MELHAVDLAIIGGCLILTRIVGRSFPRPRVAEWRHHRGSCCEVWIHR